MGAIAMQIDSRKCAGILSKIFLVAFFASFSLLCFELYSSYKTKQLSKQLTEIRKVEEKDWSKGMLRLNEDYAGWLTVYGTGIDYPVVLGESNGTYLRRDFYGEYSIAGTLFFDETTDFTKDGNRIIYGHMMRDSTMFGDLKKFKDKNFFENNGYVRLEDINGTHDYKIFAALVVSGNHNSSSFIDLQKLNNTLGQSQNRKMLEMIEERAFIYQKPLYVNKEDKYLFLVTCDYSRNNGRLVLVARSIKEQ